MKIETTGETPEPKLVAVTQGDDSIWMLMPNDKVIFLGPDGCEDAYDQDITHILSHDKSRKPVYAGEPITIRLGV